VQTGGEHYTFDSATTCVCWIEDRYYVRGATVNGWPPLPSATRTTKTFYQMENIFIPYTGTACCSRRSRANTLSQPAQRPHTPFGDIYTASRPTHSLGLLSLGHCRRLAEHEDRSGANADRDDGRLRSSIMVAHPATVSHSAGAMLLTWTSYT
jgi:hypothetical protein